MPGTSKPQSRENALANLRIRAELSPSAAAEYLEIEECNLTDIESGTVQASTPLLANMARFYQTSPFLVVKAYLADRVIVRRA